ncbi:MAG: hypothetical protein EOP06_02250 [Proteobacteria bacterium]|nr:MAG: hypothetical protein EOP06_02250 [Pseudomonadota bacterium]
MMTINEVNLDKPLAVTASLAGYYIATFAICLALLIIQSVAAYELQTVSSMILIPGFGLALSSFGLKHYLTKLNRLERLRNETRHKPGKF